MFSFLLAKSTVTTQVDLLFSEAYACLEQGLCYDEVNDYDMTLLMYEKGLNSIIEAEKMKNAKKSELYNQMMEAKPSVQHRISVLKKEGPKPEKMDKTKGNEDTSMILSQLDSAGEAEADLIFWIPGGVQLFMIEGECTAAPSYPTSLQILRFQQKMDESFVEKSEPNAFIQVGPWLYPLFKGRTPILKNEYGAYVVPNPTDGHPDMMVAILLPSDLEERVENEFREVLRQYGDLREASVKPELTTEENNRISARLANFLIASGEKIAWGVQTTSVKVASKVEASGENYRAGISGTTAPITVNPAVRGSVLYLHKGSKVVAKCTRYMLDKIGDIGVSVGRRLATGAQNNFGDGKGGGLVSGTITVLGGGIAGVSTVWMSLEDGSKILCRSIANQTVENVKLKYGDSASETTHHALFAAGHGGLAAMQIWDLGPRSIAGRMARKAGIQMVTDLHRTSSGSSAIQEKKPVQ